MNPIRLTIVETHPVQYNVPWFRYLTQECPAVDLTVLYASHPTPQQQAVGFDGSFEWDIPMFDGYRWRIVRESRSGDSFDSGRFRGLDVPEIGDAIAETRPDVALVAGWHSITQWRALAACRRLGIPLVYRGDTHLGMRPPGMRRLLWHVKTRALLRQYSAHLAVGALAREYLLAHGVPPTRIYASPHAVDNEFFARLAAPHLTASGRPGARRGYRFERDDFVVLFVGKVNERKGVSDVIKALQTIGGPVALLVAGDGDQQVSARALAARLGVRVTWAGFLNQGELGRAYAAADCLALPSHSESWGLVVNEAMATGLPAVVADTAGCADDLVSPGETGERFRAGDVADLAAALERARARGGRSQMADACRQRVSTYAFPRLAAGLVAACEAVARPPRAPRVVACCGGMVLVSGLERMTFEVLRIVRERGGTVHCIVNGWENHRIVPLVERIGASWSIGYYMYGFSRRTLNPIRHAQSVWDIIRTSAGLLRDARRFRPTHVLVPEYGAILRNAPALALLRLIGVRIVFRIGNAPERGKVYDLLWRRVLPPLVTTFVPNSRFSYGRLQETGVPARKITLIRNALSRRTVIDQTDEDVVRLAASRRTLLTVGQIAPFKGTHLAVDAAIGLVADGHDVQAIIVGALPVWPAELVEYVRDLQERIVRAGATDRVLLVGARENVPAIMRASYLLAAPILQEETFGNVVLEARSVGLPVVTFGRGGLGELVTHRDTGYICPTADLAGLREGLLYFLMQPTERERASAHSVATAARPDNDCTSTEFERRWWALFERAS
jgi:glycosyltransferase involved in cell wall biosynthesis